MGSMKITYAQTAIPTGKRTNETGYFPTITLGDAAAKELKDYEVGEECTLTMKGVVKSVSEDEREGRRVVFEAHDCVCADDDEKEEESPIDEKTAKTVARMAMKKRVA